MKLDGKGSGNPWRIYEWAERNGAVRLDDLKAYIETIYELAPKAGLNPDILIGQSHLETDGWKSDWWRKRSNPAGIGITGDPRQNEESAHFDGRTAALAHIVHMYLYVHGESLPDGFSPDMSPRWDNAVAAKYAGVVDDLDDLTGRWAVDDRYGGKIAGRLDLMKQSGLIGKGNGEMAFAKPYILLVAGHRSTNDGGSPTERSYTDDLARAYTVAFREAGYKADWWQRDLDKDNLPDMTKGGLDTVAEGVGKAIGDADADLVLMYDLHFDGPSSVVHCIPPDCVGLRTAYAGGAPAVDTAVNNTLDTNLAAEIAAELSRVLGLGIYPARRLGIKGVMSERDTNVGSQGFRLAMMAGTAPYRMKAARLVIEHAGYNQTTAINDWANKCAKAALRATGRVLEARGGPVGGEEPGGQPGPPQPLPDAAPPLPIAALTPYIKAGTLVSAPPAVVVDGAGEYIFANHMVRAVRETKRYQDTNVDGPITGINIREGERFPALFLTKDANNAWWWITGWWTRILVTDTEVVLP